MDQDKVQYWSKQKVKMYQRYDSLRKASYDALFSLATNKSKIHGLVYKTPDSNRQNLISTIISAEYGGVEKLDATIAKYGGDPNKYKEYAEGRFEKGKPGRGVAANNRMSWTPEQYQSFLSRAKPGTPFRSTIQEFSKGNPGPGPYWPGNYRTWREQFTTKHPYPGVVRLLDKIQEVIGDDKRWLGRETLPIDMEKIKPIAQQIELRLKRLYDFARTAKALSIIKSYKGIR